MIRLIRVIRVLLIHSLAPPNPVYTIENRPGHAGLPYVDITGDGGLFQGFDSRRFFKITFLCGGIF